MELVQPGIGLMFYMLLTFSLLLFILGKFAWKPIMASLKEREQTISTSLAIAKQTQEEMKRLQADNQNLLKEAKNERDMIIRDANKMKESIVNEARNKAQSEADKIVEAARENIQNEKMAAIIDLKNQVADFSIEVAEKILKRELADKESQKNLMKEDLKSINFN
ncbi:MAG: ATP synthase F0 subunit B [Bacteroidetes bacterium CG2_30_33_31]|nr:MAG: ATP synthase F0 subunit B [Bacteroidetes bacterium CG2_30_33_31]